MRLHPAVSRDEALAWLMAQATETWGATVAEEMAKDVDTLAEAMTIVSAIDVANDVEPLFP